MPATTASAASLDDALLAVEDLQVRFPTEQGVVTSVGGISFTVHRGEILCIVGESGSGKSVTAQTILGLHKGTKARLDGRVLLNGRDLVAISEEEMQHVRGNEVAMIFQNPLASLHPFYTVGSQIVEAYRVHNRVGAADAKTRVLEMLRSVGIPNAEERYAQYPHQFSGGMRQRAMIAMALVCEPRLLVADEPTTALDVTIQAEILSLLRDLRDRTDSAIILITHDMGVVADIADRVVVMKDGLVVESGTVDDVFHRPAEPYTRALLAAVPHLGTAQVEVTEALAEAEQQQAEPAVLFEHAAIEYPKRGRGAAFRAASDIDLAIAPGEVLGLVGESGSGKSTIGRALVGLVPVVEGRLRVVDVEMRGHDRKALRRLRRDIGIVFQDPVSSLNPRYPLGASIAAPLLLAGRSRSDANRRVDELLDAVELPRAFQNRYPHEVSGGQAQRIGIARALALSPKVLVADEPTSALDVSVQDRFLTLLEGLQHELQFACLFISHDLAVVDRLSHRIAVMSRGRLVEQGSKEQILRSPREEYTKRLLAAVPVPDPEEQAARRASRAQLAAAG